MPPEINRIAPSRAAPRMDAARALVILSRAGLLTGDGRLALAPDAIAVALDAGERLERQRDAKRDYMIRRRAAETASASASA